MASDNFQVRIVTPLGVAFEGDAVSVTLPTPNGEVGILPDHIEYTGLLSVGVVVVNTASGAATQFVITGGFCQVTGRLLSIIADSLDSSESVDLEKLSAERGDLQKIVDTADTRSQEWIDARLRLSRIEALSSIGAQH